uniref:Uncharacterized protein n=1 Tax=Syphacia muris TaxID=451379 RepID=A0A0N5A9M0_9BILA
MSSPIISPFQQRIDYGDQASCSGDHNIDNNMPMLPDGFFHTDSLKPYSSISELSSTVITRFKDLNVSRHVKKTLLRQVFKAHIAEKFSKPSDVERRRIQCQPPPPLHQKHFLWAPKKPRRTPRMKSSLYRRLNLKRLRQPIFDECYDNPGTI